MFVYFPAFLFWFPVPDPPDRRRSSYQPLEGEGVNTLLSRFLTLILLPAGLNRNYVRASCNKHRLAQVSDIPTVVVSWRGVELTAAPSFRIIRIKDKQKRLSRSQLCKRVPVACMRDGYQDIAPKVVTRTSRGCVPHVDFAAVLGSINYSHAKNPTKARGSNFHSVGGSRLLRVTAGKKMPRRKLPHAILWPHAV